MNAQRTKADQMKPLRRAGMLTMVDDRAISSAGRAPSRQGGIAGSEEFGKIQREYLMRYWWPHTAKAQAEVPIPTRSDREGRSENALTCPSCCEAWRSNAEQAHGLCDRCAADD